MFPLLKNDKMVTIRKFRGNKIALELGKKAVLTLFLYGLGGCLKRRHFVLLFEHFVLRGGNISFCGLYRLQAPPK